MKKYNVVYRRDGETEIGGPDFVDIVLPWYLLWIFHYIMRINRFRLIYNAIDDD